MNKVLSHGQDSSVSSNESQVWEEKLHPKMPPAIQTRIELVAKQIEMTRLLGSVESRTETLVALANYVFQCGIDIACQDLNEALKVTGRKLARGES